MYDQMSLPGMSSATSSPGSEAGRLPCALPDGQTTAPSGPDPAPASRSARRAQEQGPQMHAISGLYSPISFESAALKQFSESKSPLPSLSERLGRSLMQRLRSGSMEYDLTWKRWVTPSGLVMYRLRASARRTSGSGCTGWPTPCVVEPDTHPDKVWQRKQRLTAATGVYRGNDCGLGSKVHLAGWPTPCSQGGAGETSEDLRRVGNKWVNVRTGRVLQTNLATDVKMLVGWATCSSRDWKDTPGMAQEGMETSGKFRNRIDQLPRQAMHLTPGQTSTSSHASTGNADESSAASSRSSNRGSLNPAHSRWLMGYPAAWCQAAIRAYRKSRRQRKRAS